MNLIAGAISIIFFVSTYEIIHYFGPAWLNWHELYQTMLLRLDSEKFIAVLVLSVYMFMVCMVLVAFLRWSYSFSQEVLNAIKKRDINKIKENAQTLDNSLIIDSPKLKKPVVRFVETIFSAVIWLIFMYIFQVIPATFFWIFGLERIYFFNFSQQTIDGTIDAMFMILYTALVCFLVLFIWAQWNYWRYGRLERRKSMPPVANEEMGAFYSLPPEVVEGMQDAKRMSIMSETTEKFNVEILETLNKADNFCVGEQNL